MGVLREGAGRIKARFTLYQHALPDAQAARVAFGLVTESLGGLRWRWIVPAGAGVAILALLLMRALLYSYVLVPYFLELGVPEKVHPVYIRAVVFFVLPAMYLLLTVAAAYSVASRAGTAPRRHGLMVGLVSVAVLQAIGLTEGPFSLTEAVLYLVLAVGGGLLGAAWARRALDGREALYRASRDIGAADGAHGIVAAIGEHLAGPEDEGVAFWRLEDRTEGGEGPVGFVQAESWTPPGSGGWPSGTRLDAQWVSDGLRRGSPVALRTRELPGREREAWEREGVRSALLVPLGASRGAEIGLLVVASRRGRYFSKGAVRAYQTIGAQAALALENLRLVEEALKAGRQAGVLRERQRMAHEIHDTLAQGFTSIVMNLEAVEEIEPPASETARRHLEGARQAARESLTEARRLVWALRPESLDRRSLVEALQGLSDRWAQETGVSVRANATGTPRGLPPETEVALLRVAQEALGNVRKHAGARRAALTLSYMDDLVVLDILDDGAGFDPCVPRAGVGAGDSGGFGLRSMRERVEILGGRFSVDSSPGNGTSLTVELPTGERETPEEVR